MASSIKSSLAVNNKTKKKKRDPMPPDDFYKEAQRQHLRELLETKTKEHQVDQSQEVPVKPLVTDDDTLQEATKVDLPANIEDEQVQSDDEQLSVVAESTSMPEPVPMLTPEVSLPTLSSNEVIIAADDDDFDDFDFASDYDNTQTSGKESLLPDNTAKSSLAVGFVGIGGGGGKMAKAFLDCGFNKTLVINTTPKDQPEGLDSKHFLLLPGADGVGKDVALGKQVLKDNGAFVEDRLRTRFGQVDWLFVLAGSGGGTGSACASLDGCFNRYLKSVQASGKVVYVITSPTAQELLNPTIRTNYELTKSDVKDHPHIIIDNERQLQLLRGKIGMLGMYPSANKTFAKLFAQILKLSAEHSPVQTFDSKDLERCLNTSGRIFIGTSVIRDPSDSNLGAQIYQNCLQKSPCPLPRGNIQAGVLLLVVTPQMASDPQVSNHMEAAISYVGGRATALFSGVYVKKNVPGLIAITLLGGIN